PYFEIDPVDAEARGIVEGVSVRVFNDRGELTLPARISDRLRPGLAAIPWGWWGEEANANVLTNDTASDWGGAVAFYDTLVEATTAD
ncbi:MAG TPA: molybdopterin dinucleotide binding domain-containing protein, partial [Acidimicrobiia bacterium]|nr:molybdopterin dinucleotide binding domain-containing protein [Acidimicrobiia bacterium]